VKNFVVFLLISAAAVAGLLAWVMVSNQPRQFAVPMDHGRELPQGDFYVSAVVEPKDLNPLTSRDAWALSFVIGYTHDCLMQLSSATGALEPALASLVEPSKDQLTFLFALREGLKFSDGSPVTLADVAFTYEVGRVKDVALGSIADSIRALQSFEVLGDRRFRISLKRRHFTGLAGFATDYRVVKRQWFLDRIAELAAAEGLPGEVGLEHPEFGRLLGLVQLPGPGTGPYQMAVDGDGQVVWERGRELWLVQNLQSWRRVVQPRAWNLAGMRLRVIGSTQAVYTELRKERIDWHMPMDMDALLEQDPDLLKKYRRFDYDTPAAGQFFVLWNHARQPLADVRVRRALTMLFDRERIAEELFGGSARVANCWFQPNSADYSPDLPAIGFDPVAARALLAEAGYGAGLQHGPLQLEIVAATEERYRRILEMAQSAFENAGVVLQAQLMGNTAAKKRRAAGEFDGYMMYWRHSLTGVDPFEFFHSNPQNQAGGHNLMRYRNVTVDTLLAQARAEVETEARRAIYHRFNHLIHQDQAITFFVHPRNTLLLHQRFQAAAPGWRGITPEMFWVAPKDQIHRRGLGQ
jgi:peptide/nickel transport system substrate-binding protein